MDFHRVDGLDLKALMPEGCKEDVIEKAWATAITSVCPSTYTKTSFANGRNDGILRFYNDNGDLKFWINNESKRDVYSDDSALEFSLVQSLMYLGNIFYDVTPYDLEAARCGGIFLTSKNYFCYIPKNTVNLTMRNFENLWHKYFRIPPCHAYLKRDLLNFVCNQKIIQDVKDITPDFRLDTIIKNIYGEWNLQ